MKFLVQGINYVLGKSLQARNIFIGNSLNYVSRKRSIDKNYLDYIRLATLELISNQVNVQQLPGSVAELGVYKGKFARYINEYFPDRKLYLFDTFEGFDQRDIAKEQQQNYSSGNQNFSETSIEAVMKKMKYPEQCIPVKGYFPESASGIEEQFVFVSLDTDLYEPIYAGLQFFFPRLVHGGYIFVHDFNNDGYKGVKDAVVKFCSENKLAYVPLPDTGGSVVIGKG